jgi:hypothetical protein
LKQPGVLRACCRKGLFSFSCEALEEFLLRYRAQGCPAVSHSERYRSLYRPAYRVAHAVFEAFCRFLPLRPPAFAEKKVVVAIDGNSGSERPDSAAAGLGLWRESDPYGRFLFAAPSKKRPAPAGARGNIDYERFLSQVTRGLQSGGAFSYQKYTCGAMRLREEISVSPARLTVVEGCYSLRPDFAKSYDLKVFLKVSPEEQRQRILCRSGAALFERFLNEWIPLENRYFQAFDIEKACGLVFDRTDRPPIPAIDMPS